jgi:hypothetical protein
MKLWGKRCLGKVGAHFGDRNGVKEGYEDIWGLVYMVPRIINLAA